jgi:hypothetical protein
MKRRILYLKKYMQTDNQTAWSGKLDDGRIIYIAYYEWTMKFETGVDIWHCIAQCQYNKINLWRLFDSCGKMSNERMMALLSDKFDFSGLAEITEL